MNSSKEKILEVLDQCADNYTFPILDNGYIYLAATKLSVYRSDNDWAIVIEIFGFSPRSGEPDIQIYTFSNNLYNRNSSSDYVTEEAYENYIRNNPHNESRFIHPIENSDWQDEDDLEYIAGSGFCMLRGSEIALPELGEYEKYGIKLEEERPLTFEFCRFLAGKFRDKILCSESERRVSVVPEMKLMIQLDIWNHPDISKEELPSSSKTFKLIAELIVAGNAESYENTEQGNTYWVNWPESGTL